MELEGDLELESRYLHVQDLGWSSAGSLTASADLLGLILRCEAKGSLFLVSLRVLTCPETSLEILFLYLVLTLKISDTLR